jgi:hypothetical protein
MIKLYKYYVVLLSVFYGLSVPAEEAKKDSNQEVIQVAVSFIEAMQTEKFAGAYRYLHPDLKKNWGRKPVTLLDFSDYTVASKFTLPDNFISDLMIEQNQNEWPVYLFAEIMKLAHDQEAFPIDITAFESQNGSIELLNVRDTESVYTVPNDDNMKIKIFMSIVGDSWKILKIEQSGNGPVALWPKGMVEGQPLN